MSADEQQFGFSVETKTLNGQRIPAGTLQVASSLSKTTLSIAALRAIQGAYQHARGNRNSDSQSSGNSREPDHQG